MVNQDFAETALGVENHENNPKQEHSHRPLLLVNVGVPFYCTSQRGVCCLPAQPGSGSSVLTSLPTHLLWESGSLGKSDTMAD